MQDLTSEAAAYYNHQSLKQQPQELILEQEQLKCPRCNSQNTKFCYYNNYNLLQPRHFCKNCRRYWTKGGSLRNVPVGGGSRKNNKRPGSGSGKNIAVSNEKPVSDDLGSGSKSEDPTRMLYGLPVGDPSFSSLLGANMYEVGLSGGYPGMAMGSGMQKSGDDDTWTDLAMNRG